jgi:hypothetical protein
MFKRRPANGGLGCGPIIDAQAAIAGGPAWTRAARHRASERHRRSREAFLCRGHRARQHLALVSAGCAGQAGIVDACQKQCDCSGHCRNIELEACVTEAGDSENAAEDAMCRAEFDDYVTCVSGSCIASGSDLRNDCGQEVVALQKCMNEAAAEE